QLWRPTGGTKRGNDMTSRRTAGALVAAATAAATLTAGAIGAGAHTPPPLIPMTFSTEGGPPGGHGPRAHTPCVRAPAPPTRPTPPPHNTVTAPTSAPAPTTGVGTADSVTPPHPDPDAEFFISGQCPDGDRVTAFYDSLPFNVPPPPPTPPPPATTPPAPAE